MEYKVLVADDSQTIQKVINITLSSEPYLVSECLAAKDLVKCVEEEKPQLVFLDFNLSEDKTGYDLCQDILNINEDTLVVFLMGTFDTIDEDLINKSGAKNWIVKPFDGNKFIGLCRALLQGNNESVVVEEDSSWEMQTTAQDDSPKEEVITPSLQEELSDWGIEVPGIIGVQESNFGELPPVIGEESIIEEKIIESEDAELIYPDKIDLEYPSEDFSLQEQADNLKESLSLKEQVSIESDDLWSVDEVESTPEESEEVNFTHSAPEDFPKDVMEEAVDNVIEKVEQIIEPNNEVQTAQELNADSYKDLIEETIKAECAKIAEKVAWEIIPDLAENIIKSEIEKIKREALGN